MQLNNFGKAWRALASTWLLITMGLSMGCSSSRVHLYSAALTDAETLAITSAIENAGFNVLLNRERIPDEVTSPLVVYSIALKSPELVSEVGDALQRLGFSQVEYKAYTVGNHVYSGNNIGVYPRPHQVVANTMPEDLPGYFRTKCPKHSGDLEIVGEKKFVFNFGPKGSEDFHHRLVGEVSWEKDSLIFSKEDGESIRYGISYQDSTDQYGTTRRVTIQPTDKATLMGCEFWINFVR